MEIPPSSEQQESLSDSSPQKQLRPLRVWPAIIAIVLILMLRFAPRDLEIMPLWWLYFSFMGPAVCGLGMLVWWGIFSRATRLEALVGLIAILSILVMSWFLAHESMDMAGFMLVTIPIGFVLFGISSLIARSWTPPARSGFILLITLVGFASSLLVRNNGIWGDYNFELAWRWTPTNEELAIAEQQARTSAGDAIVSEESFNEWLAEPAWPGFRGPERYSQQSGAELADRWDNVQPELVWKRTIGPAWSSFVVAGNLLFTQEQRGEHETTACYTANEGKLVWETEIESRFAEPMGGAGPRATPTLAEGQLFAMGASGSLLALEPRTGDILWERELKTLADRGVPVWGFSSSPLVVEKNVIVHAGGVGEMGVLAFEIEKGELAWSAVSGNHTYSSPQLCQLFGKDYVAIYDNQGLRLLDPSTGEVRLEDQWGDGEFRVTQPQVVGEDKIVLAGGMQDGTRLIQFHVENEKLTAKEVWHSLDLKSDYNDFVVSGDYLYGFDGSIFTCVDLSTGKRKWKRGRYGKGQVLLLTEINRLLVISEKGEVVLLEVNPEKHVETGTFEAIEGKTWNHPVVVGDRLYVRNAQEAACYRLPTASSELAAK
ncbi:outer membrane biogenesis protein BamB [Polystyrenella longa]|uniref:Outer membrane biogenesis protein BamB n=1 Tax=Polystyrenella longa TaxID=2528007 RepID=A0A518CKI6_9PLAN|nr:PQQ-binding-like beta-propeller repeat protein [Polystyrenella longa]QDU79745.1 outer membrane biogenesis protein BamB [Polystyrenella longa]